MNKQDFFFGKNIAFYNYKELLYFFILTKISLVRIFYFHKMTNTSSNYISSTALCAFPNLICAQSTCGEGNSSEIPLRMNLSLSVGDKEDNVRNNRSLFFGELGIPLENIATQKQIHSNNAAIIHTPCHIENNDALITSNKNVFLCVSVADCYPVFLFDKKENIIAAIHSGWRGTSNGIVQSTIALMKKEFSLLTKNMVCWIGAGAGKCCYEIQSNVASQFDTKYLQQISATHFLADLQSCLKDILLNEGIPDENIETNHYCTIHQQTLFHSFRRDGDRSGRMFGVIGMKH